MHIVEQNHHDRILASGLIPDPVCTPNKQGLKGEPLELIIDPSRVSRHQKRPKRIPPLIYITYVVCTEHARTDQDILCI